MPRLAWFAPLPPVRSGIAQYNRELLPSLSSSHQVDLFVDGPPSVFEPAPQGTRILSAHDFVWANRCEPYDLMVYHMGNAPCHDYIWAYLVRHPGLVVLHDGQLHHARGRLLLQQRRQDDYRSEFWFSHPGAKKDLAEVGAAGLLGSLTYVWPMLRVVVESSRRMLVHNQWLAGQIREAHPDAQIDVVEMGVPDPAPRLSARQEIRSRHAVSENAIVFTAFGKVTQEKRLSEALRALAWVAEAAPEVHLLLVGETVQHYDLRADVHLLGLEHKVTFTGYVADEEIDDYLAAADISLCMRWPTSRETSASWLRSLAAGKPMISTDLVHTVDIPTLDPRNWSILSTEAAEDPVGVSIDILDEDHSLKLAMRRLATDVRLRATLGRNARALWVKRFRVDRMAAGYARVITDALSAPFPDGGALAGFPEHLRSTGLEHAERVLREVGLPADLDAAFWTPEQD